MPASILTDMYCQGGGGSYQAVFIEHLKKKPMVLWADLQT